MPRTLLLRDKEKRCSRVWGTEQDTSRCLLCLPLLLLSVSAEVEITKNEQKAEGKGIETNTRPTDF
jgi:hypothetical protein